MIKDYFFLALRNLKKRKLRSFLTLIGIIASISTIFVLIGLSLGLQGAVEEQFRTLGSDKLFIFPATGFLGPPGSVGGTILAEKDIETIKKVKGVEDYSYFVISNAEVKFGDEIKYLAVIGVPTENMDVFTEGGAWSAEEGINLEKGDSGKLMVGSLFGEGKVFSSSLERGNKLKINNEKFEIKAIAKPIGNPADDSSILIPLEDLRRVFKISERVDQIVVKVDEGENIFEVAERIENKLIKTRGVTKKTKDFVISTPDELLESFGNVLDIITVFLIGIASISLFVGGVGIANTMYTSVIERTKEIGIMKAVGARNSEIVKLFLIESGLLGLVGGIVGVIFGILIGNGIEYIAINNLNTNLLAVETPLILIFGSLIFAFVIGGISGLIPSWGASKTNIVDALRYE
ncbi:MAG: ABC transporter permease [Candidatus Pacearchaeota archaeon]|nr:ABC transporter permease [Candidatus Pacearchaeota archaeon]